MPSQPPSSARARALAYLERKGTRADFDSIVGRLRSAAARVDALLAAVGDDAARRRPAPGKWSLQEVADHLAVSHRRALDQFAALVAGRDAGPAIEAGLLSAEPHGRPFRDVRAELARVHRDWLEAADSVDSDALDAGRAAPVWMVVRDAEAGGDPEEWIEHLDPKAFALAFAVHTREHLDQLERILTALGERDDLPEGPVLATARLQLRPVGPDDSDELHRVFTTPEVRRYLFDDRVLDADETAGIVDTSRRQFRSHGHGLWLAEPVGGGAVVGFAGLWFFFDPPQLQLLFGLRPTDRGRGYATEAAGCILDHALAQLGLDSVVGMTDEPNAASVRVMERLGMERVDRRVHDGRPNLVFRKAAPPV